MNAVSSSLTSLRLFVSSSTTLGIRSSGMGAVCCSSNLSTVPHPHSLERFPPGHIVGGVRPLRLDPAPQGKRRERLVDTGSENQSTAVTDLPPSTSSHSLPIGQMFRAVTRWDTNLIFYYYVVHSYSRIALLHMNYVHICKCGNGYGKWLQSAESRKWNFLTSLVYFCFVLCGCLL